MSKTIENNAKTAEKINAAELKKLVTMTADERAAAAKTADAVKIADMILDAAENAADDAEKRAAELKNAAAAAIAAAKTALLDAAAKMDDADDAAAAAENAANYVAKYDELNAAAIAADDAKKSALYADYFGTFAADANKNAAIRADAENAAKNADDERAAAEKRAADERAAIVAKIEKYDKNAAAADDADIAAAMNAAAENARRQLVELDNAAAEKRAAADAAAIRAAIAAVFGIDLNAAAPKTAAPKTAEKRAAADKYTYIDAVCDAVTDEWQTAGPIAKNAEKIGKLAQIKTNSRWTGAFANALTDAADDGLIERRNNGKHNEYRRRAAAVMNAAD